MKIRIISGLIGIAVLIGVLLLGKTALGIAVFAATLIGMYEFFNCMQQKGYKPVKFIGYIACLPVLMLGLYGSFDWLDKIIKDLGTLNYLFLFIFAIQAVLMALIVFKHKKYNIVDASLTVMGIFYVVFMFAFIILTRNLDKGVYFIWLIFFAWVTDTMAYFTGRAFGKRKLAPEISPKKTVAGSIGGILGCVIVTLIYGYILKSNNSVNIELYHYAIIGVLVAVLSQIGDLAASAIKRYAGIKDYGNIMPGHGGILDRFDSVVFIAPIIYFYLTIAAGQI